MTNTTTTGADQGVVYRLNGHELAGDDGCAYYDIATTAMWSGRTVEIDEEMYLYWLGVLPPVYMGRDGLGMCSAAPVGATEIFGFVEGRDYIVDFWQEGARYFCKRSGRLNTRG